MNSVLKIPESIPPYLAFTWGSYSRQSSRQVSSPFRGSGELRILSSAMLRRISVSMNETYDEEQSTYLQSLIRGYGAFYETPEATELPAILEQIAASIPISIVK